MLHLVDQIAMYSLNIDEQIERLSDLGAEHWVRDTIEAEASVRGQEVPTVFVAQLAFNYQLIPGKEFELIRPLTWPNYLSVARPRRDCEGMIAHLGIHADDISEAELNRVAQHRGPLLQDCKTRKHENPDVGERRYHYKIWAGSLAPIKVIRRLNV